MVARGRFFAQQQALSITARAQAVEAMPCEGRKKRLDLGSYVQSLPNHFHTANFENRTI